MEILRKAIVVAVCLPALLPTNVVFAEQTPSHRELPLTCEAAILIEASTGRVVYEKNADDRRYPASTTKMMTAVLAAENLRDDEPIVVSERAAATDESYLELAANDMMTAKELTTGMMLVSDNDAAVALAEQIGGNVENFADMMNDKAKQIGCLNTHFVNPNGLPDANHYSTARDMAKIAAYCMENKKFAGIVAIEKAVIHYVLPQDKIAVAENTNELLADYDGAIGIKTGWTNAAGGCLAAAAKRRGVKLIAVVLGAPDTDSRFDDARKLLDYGFAHVKMHRGVSASRTQTGVWIKNGESYRAMVGPVTDVDYPLIDGESPDKYSFRYEIPRFLDAPAIKGDKIGKLVLEYDGKTVGEVEVALRETVPQGFSLISFLFVGLLSLIIGS